jgi:hypothetical protein
MTATKNVAQFDIVELVEPVDTAPVGARGGVLDILSDEFAMVEFTSMPREPILDRIVVVPLDKLRVVEPAKRSD